MSEPGYHLMFSGIGDLDERHPAKPAGIAVGRVYDEDGLRVRTIAIDEGAVLAEHTAGVPVLIHVVAGRMRIEIGGQTLKLETGGLIRADAHTPHSVTALTPARLVLTLIG